MRDWLARLGLLLLVGAVVGCAPQAVYPPTPTKTPDPAFALMLADATPGAPGPDGPSTPTQEPTASLPPEPNPASTGEAETPAPAGDATIPPGETPAPPADGSPPPAAADITAEAPTFLSAEHYWMRRPIPSGHQDYLDRTYPYGGTAGGRFRPHTGVEFFNPAGTPVVAVANAVVHYAGTDAEVLFGPQPDFYGNLIVLQLSGVAYNGQAVYALYGHLSAISVEAGQSVAAGDQIGAVGGTGIASGGAHLHFEVRIGDPMGYFTSTRNPDLWIQPYGGYGTIAGRVLSADGFPLREVSIIIRGEDYQRYTWTYAGDENIPDNEARESFTYGDLPQGWYTVSASSGRRIHNQRVYVEAGRTSLVEIVFEQ